MSKRMNMLLLALVAVFALGGIAAGAAMAEPEFVAQGGKTFPLSLTSSGGSAELNTGKHKISCTSAVGEGQISATPTTTSSMLGWVRFHSLECKTAGAFGENAECQNHGAGTKLILTPWYPYHIGKLITLTNAIKHVLLLILVSAGAASIGGVAEATKFECATNPKATVTMTGNLVGLLNGEYNSKTSTEALFSFEQTSAGKQQNQTFEFTLPAQTFAGLHLTLETVTSLTKETEEFSEVWSGKLVTDGPVELKA